MKKRLRSIIIALAALMILTPLSPVRADVAPPPVPNGTNITPGTEQTQVRMVSETVIIEVAAQSQNDAGQAYVTASFQMRNLGSAPEEMQVRFPLCSAYSPDDQYGCFTYPPLQNFGVRVDGAPEAVQNTIKQLALPDGSGVKVPTWANFPVTFPPGKDVNIQVRYTQPGYQGSGPGNSEYQYILATGAGWKGTIGTADIIVRLPIPANEETVYDSYPNTKDNNLLEPNRAELADHEIHIHLEDFEPGDSSIRKVSTTILLPKVWQQIQTESKNVAAHPNDGESWGRLGKAYKTAVLMEKERIRLDQVGEALYWKSVDAYQKAVDLLPRDADWHYGFAELLFSNMIYNHYFRDGEDLQALQVQTVQQIKQALDINPKHAGALELLQEVSYSPGLVDLNGKNPVYLILTATPTSMPEPTGTTAQAPTATRQLISTNSPTLTASSLPAVSDTPAATAMADQVTPTHTSGRAKIPGLCGSAMIPGFIVAVVLTYRRRGSNRSSKSRYPR